jgi:cofilin
MSGIAVSDDCVQKFNELKLGHAHRYVTFKMNATNTEVVVEHVGGPNSTYEDFKSQLPEKDCRYAIFDYEFQIDGGQRNKITFILWAPDSAPIKAKMMYTSTKDSIKKKLVGIQVEVQATDAAEISEDAVAERAKKDVK